MPSSFRKASKVSFRSYGIPKEDAPQRPFFLNGSDTHISKQIGKLLQLGSRRHQLLPRQRRQIFLPYRPDFSGAP